MTAERDRLLALFQDAERLAPDAQRVRAGITRGIRRRAAQRRAALGTSAALVLALAAGVGLAAGTQPADVLVPARPLPPTASPSPTAVTPSPTPTAAPRTPAATPAPSPISPSSSPTSTSPAFPPAAAQVNQGDLVWAVYLAVSRLQDGVPVARAELDRAREAAEAVGYQGEVGDGDVDCAQGAREALQLNPDIGYFTASILFATEADARQFITAYEPGVVGLAQITAFCLD